MYEELEEESARQQQLWPDADVVDAYAQEHPEAFAGRWWSGPDMTVAFVAAEEHRRELHRRVANPERVHVVNVSRTLAELSALQERVETDMEQETGQTFRITMVGVQEDDNCVVVGIKPYSEAAAAELRRRHGDALRVEDGPEFFELSAQEYAALPAEEPSSMTSPLVPPRQPLAVDV
jgi:hypothetical protein